MGLNDILTASWGLILFFKRLHLVEVVGITGLSGKNFITGRMIGVPVSLSSIDSVVEVLAGLQLDVHLDIRLEALPKDSFSLMVLLILVIACPGYFDDNAGVEFPGGFGSPLLHLGDGIPKVFLFFFSKESLVEPSLAGLVISGSYNILFSCISYDIFLGTSSYSSRN